MIVLRTVVMMWAPQCGYIIILLVLNDVRKPPAQGGSRGFKWVVLPAAERPCGAQPQAGPENSLRGLTAAAVNSSGQSVHEVRCRALARGLRASAPTQAPHGPPWAGGLGGR